MFGINYLIKEGYEKLKVELDEMKIKGWKEVVVVIVEVCEKGDLLENVEYDVVKDVQGMLELKISEMEKVLFNFWILDVSQLDMFKVIVFSNVFIKNIKMGKIVKYILVFELEVDFKVKKIFVNFLIGKGFLGKEVGEIVIIEILRGNIDFEVMNILID